MAWTSVRTWAVNETLTAAKMNEISANLSAEGDSWTSYTPSWFASGTSPAVGNGSITGKYRVVGKSVDFRILFITGSSTTYGTGVYNFTLPSAPTALTTWETLGSASITDTSAGDHYGLIATFSGGSNVTATNGSAGRIGPALPFTFASTDIISILGRYTTT